MSEWISVKDGLPEHTPAFCNVLLGGKYHWFAAYDCLLDKDGEDIEGEFDFFMASNLPPYFEGEVTHWFYTPPLPEPPQEKP